MLKKTLVLVALAGAAHADTRVYDIHATRVAEVTDPDGMGHYRSCGAAKRMMKDRHVLRIDDEGNVTINGFRWKALTEEPDLYLSFHGSVGQKTSLAMDLYVNQRGLSGRYLLFGVTPDEGDPKNQLVCVDAVYVDGTAR